MGAPKNAGVKKERLSFGQSLVVVAGGILGAGAGWLFAGEELSRLSAATGLFFGADGRGPVILGYLIMGGLAGTLVFYLLTRVWARIKRP
ncbi:MAG TPA: hypothetical protein VF348_09510 [Usitatibacter sp.]